MPLFWVFIAVSVVTSGILTLYQANLMIKISSGEFDLFMIYMVSTLIAPITNALVLTPMTSFITYRVSKVFIRGHLVKYYNISQESKNEKSFYKFDDAMKNATNSIVSMITWGFGTCIDLASSTISLLMMVYAKSLFKEFFVIVVAFGIFHYFVLNKLQVKLSKYVMKEQEKRRNARALIQLRGVSFQYREDSIDDMFSLYDIIEKTNYNSAKSWNSIGRISNVFLTVVAFFYMLFTIHNIGMFLLITMAIQKLTSSVESFNHFTTAYERMKIDYTSFLDMYNDTVTCEDPIRQNLGTDSFLLKKVEITRGDYNIKLDSTFGDFVLKAGMKVLIEGPTGMGKSSFLKGLFGLLNNSNIDIRSSSNIHVQGSALYCTVADYFQEIKERMPISLITLRNFFKNEQDDGIVKQYLLNAWNAEEYERIITQIKSKNPDVSEQTHPYDMYIHEALSGGQKSRLILWNRGYIADKTNREIIILDEPIVDVDFDKYIQQLNEFFKCYNNKMIFMVGHLCDCKRDALNVNKIFNMEIYINNGLITRRR
jgi:ABC-type transport system involved in cytochrome bd biosynthesis fused ATPase/permease subunit